MTNSLTSIPDIQTTHAQTAPASKVVLKADNLHKHYPVSQGIGIYTIYQ